MFHLKILDETFDIEVKIRIKPLLGMPKDKNAAAAAEKAVVTNTNSISSVL